eukprot:4405940-Pyramimonas_sp.AAC.1
MPRFKPLERCTANIHVHRSLRSMAGSAKDAVQRYPYVTLIVLKDHITETTSITQKSVETVSNEHRLPGPDT